MDRLQRNLFCAGPVPAEPKGRSPNFPPPPRLDPAGVTGHLRKVLEGCRITFTPVRGCSATVAEYITGARVLETETCELLPDQQCWPGLGAGLVPYQLECMNPEHAVIFFQSKHNPFIDYEELKKLWKSRSRSDILIRLHGVTDKRSGNVFPRFGAHNIIPHARIPEEGTNYHFTDFAWNRKWFMLWFRVWEINGK